MKTAGTQGFDVHPSTQAADNNLDYGKSGDRKDTIMQSKEISSKTMEMTKAGGQTSGGGPTESTRSYPKGGKPSMNAAAFNPMNGKPSTYGIGGVGKGES